jgi:hypothetical protein
MVAICALLAVIVLVIVIVVLVLVAVRVLLFHLQQQAAKGRAGAVRVSLAKGDGGQRWEGRQAPSHTAACGTQNMHILNILRILPSMPSMLSMHSKHSMPSKHTLRKAGSMSRILPRSNDCSPRMRSRSTADCWHSMISLVRLMACSREQLWAGEKGNDGRSI